MDSNAFSVDPSGDSRMNDPANQAKSLISVAIVSLMAAFLCASDRADAAIGQQVPVDGGLVLGVAGRTAGFTVFKGIPYAAPPVGDLRWRPPAPVIPWKGVRPADKFAPDCFPARPAKESTAASQNEDCLYLNVWTPAKTAGDKLPVMVWIYGGGWATGSPSYRRYDGDGLNREGVILVSMNYRTSVFGFLNHPLLTAESPEHVSGNYGILDHIAALKWVRRNIAAFGGDPDRVTIFGQSSGGEAVNILTLSPLAKGLFQRAIGESGGMFGQREPKTLADGEAEGVTFAKAGNFADSLADLRARTPEELIKATPPKFFVPVVDGWVLPADGHDTFAADRQNDVPILVGSNADEGQLSVTLTPEEYSKSVHDLFGRNAGKVLKLYPADNDDQARLSMKQLQTMLFGDYNVTSWATGQMARGKSPVFQYRFTHHPPAQPGGPAFTGAPHGAEIIYAFNNLDVEDRAWTGEDRLLEKTISAYWVNFAKSGDPNGPGLPPWPSLQQEKDTVLEIGDRIRLTPRPNMSEIDFLEKLFYGDGGVYRPS